MFFIILLLGLGAFIFVNPSVAKPVTNLFYYSPCDTPQYYIIGDVDPRFNLSQEVFAQAVSQAALVWNNTEEKILFVEDTDVKSKNPLTIRLVYDKRQLLNSQVDAIENEVEQKKSTLKVEIAQYENDLANFKSRVAALNSKIQEWNNQGGAPKEEYDKLVSEQKSLQEEGRALNERAQKLNISTESYNMDVGSLQQAVNNFNQALERKPEEGLYDPKDNTITIYFNNSYEELLHTLIHEFGHALGMDHIPNEDAIMYPFVNEITTPSIEDAAMLEEICRKRSIIELIQERIAQMKNRKATTE